MVAFLLFFFENYYFSNCFNVLLIIETQSNNCSLVITKGGAKRIMFPCVGLANKPLSRKAIQIFQAVSLSSVSLIKIAFNNPLPLTPLTIFEVSINLDNSVLNNSPKS